MSTNKPRAPVHQPQSASSRCGRETVAGSRHDPEKHRQILSGARQVFLERGFDGASMSDIARVAGVSKGTLYVYFENKEDLFAALISRKCDEAAERLFVLDRDEPDIEKVLITLGLSYIESMVQPEHIAALRTIIAIGNKFPQIGRRYYEAGHSQGIRRLSVFLAAKVEQGVLDITDVEQAASQFLSLCNDRVALSILLGDAEGHDLAQTTRVVEGAVRLFMNAYGVNR